MIKIRKRIFIVIIAVVFTMMTAAFSVANRGLFAYAEEVDTLEKLRDVPVEEIARWEQYDSRNYGIVTGVKNQGGTNLCWVYGSLAAMETNILRQGFTEETCDTLDLDEVEFAKAFSGKWNDPLDLADGDNNRKDGSSVSWDHTGSVPMVAQFAARGQGVYKEGEITEDEPKERYSTFLLRNAVTCDGDDVDGIKKLIAGYGGVAFTYNSGYMEYNYYYATGLKDHACFIVGWDDTIDKSEFRNPYSKTPSQNGGWIVKNSRGAESFMDGYFYLSYDSDIYEVTAFDMAAGDEYDWCYNYSDKEYTTASYGQCAPDNAENFEFAAVYKAQKGDSDKEYLKGVSVGVVGNDVQISVSVYTDVDEAYVDFGNKSAFEPRGGNLAATGTYTAPSTGIYTVALNARPELFKDSYFTVLVKVSGGYIVNDSYAGRSGKTLTYAWDGQKWNGMNFALPPYLNGVLCIKALTVTRSENEEISISGGTVSLSDTSFVYNGSAHTPEVTVELDGKKVSSENYSVTYSDNINAGTAYVDIKGTGNYTGELRATFRIEKAARPNFKVTMGDWTCGQTAATPSVYGYGSEEGEVTYTYGVSKSGPFDADLPEAAGSYYVRAEMSETDNYESAVAFAQFTIFEAPDLPDPVEPIPPEKPEPPEDNEEPEEPDKEQPSDGDKTPDESYAPEEKTPDGGGNNIGVAVGVGVGAVAVGGTGVAIFMVIRRFKRR